MNNSQRKLLQKKIEKILRKTLDWDRCPHDGSVIYLHVGEAAAAIVGFLNPKLKGRKTRNKVSKILLKQSGNSIITGQKFRKTLRGSNGK